MQHQNGNHRSLNPGSNQQHADSHQGSMPSTAFPSDQKTCLLLTSPFIEPGKRKTGAFRGPGSHPNEQQRLVGMTNLEKRALKLLSSEKRQRSSAIRDA